jgi:hypothetical protein
LFTAGRTRGERGDDGNDGECSDHAFRPM